MNLPCQLDAGHPGHALIGHDRCETLSRKRAEGLDARPNTDHRKFVADGLDEQRHDLGVIVDDEY